MYGFNFPSKLVLICIFLITVSCGVKNPTLVNLSPVSENVTEYSNRKFAYFADNELEVYVCFQKTENERTFFYVECTNHSDKKVLLHPGKFYCEYYSNLIDQEGMRNVKVDAITPEAIKNEIIDYEIRQVDEDYGNESLINCCCVLSGTFATIATLEVLDDDDDEEDDVDPGPVLDLAVDMYETMQEDTDIRHAEKIEFLENLRYDFNGDFLHRSFIEPEKTEGGEIAFPYLPEKYKVNLFLPIGDRLLSFEFKIEEIKNSDQCVEICE